MLNIECEIDWKYIMGHCNLDKFTSEHNKKQNNCLQVVKLRA